MTPKVRRDPQEFLAYIEALAGMKSTHVLVRQDTGETVFAGTFSQCRYVQEGYDLDMRSGHPDAVGPTAIRPIDVVPKAEP